MLITLSMTGKFLNVLNIFNKMKTNNEIFQNFRRPYCKKIQDMSNEIMDLGNDYQWQPQVKS